MPKVFGFIGFSGAGKTTAALEVARHCAGRRRVGVIKDAHCVNELDTPGKDSWRYLQAGAQQVLLRTPVGWRMVKPTTEREPIAVLLEHMRDVDWVLVEGFKYEGDYPKIEVRRAGVHDERAWLCQDDQSVVAVISDMTPPKALPTFGFHELARVIEFLESL